MKPDDNLLRVSVEMGVTRCRTVMLWKKGRRGDTNGSNSTQRGVIYRIWLMDMLGVMGAQRPGDQNRNDVYLASQLSAMGLVVQASCFVTGSNPDDQAKSLFEEVCNVLGSRVFVGHNYSANVFDEKERDRLRQQSKNAYGDILRKVVPGEKRELSVALTKLFRSNGARRIDLDREEGVAEVRHKLLRWILSRFDDVREAIGREANSREVRRKSCYVTNVMQGTVGTVATTLPFVPAGIELAIGSGYIIYASAALCGPLALAVGVTAAAGYVARWWRQDPEDNV